MTFNSTPLHTYKHTHSRQAAVSRLKRKQIHTKVEKKQYSYQSVNLTFQFIFICHLFCC